MPNLSLRDPDDGRPMRRRMGDAQASALNFGRRRNADLIFGRMPRNFRRVAPLA